MGLERFILEVKLKILLLIIMSFNLERSIVIFFLFVARHELHSTHCIMCNCTILYHSMKHIMSQFVHVLKC